MIIGTTVGQKNKLVEIPERLTPIFVALVGMDINLKQIIKKCDPTICELQEIVDLEKEYTSDQDHKIRHTG